MILHHHRLPWYKSEYPIFQLTYPFNTHRTSAGQMSLARLSHTLGNSEKEKWIHVSQSHIINPIPWVVMATFGLWNPKWPGFPQLQFVVPSQLFCHFVSYIPHIKGNLTAVLWQFQTHSHFLLPSSSKDPLTYFPPAQCYLRRTHLFVVLRVSTLF